ncbi:hypothetical protein FHS91_002402 [Sphingobium xanthum]|jgi:hypothetical protein|uniref:CHRD domain-containing protein n=1 Tax=Sphingobium xanthum TaxID=1387165 RepID=UPI001FECEE8E|nr:CHRD domain-containing protein [Sphingobium xanthum]
MRNSLKVALLAMTAVTLAVPGQAAVFVFYGHADGLQEVAPNASPGTGFALVTYDDLLRTLRLEAEFSGLIGTTTASHIHVGNGPGTNGGVATQTPSFVGFPLGVTAGSYDQTFDLTLASSFNAAFMNANGGTPAGAEAALAMALKAGRAYLNIHSTAFPGGEIRANLIPTPEPASWAMMIGGFALAGAALRRRSLNVRFA